MRIIAINNPIPFHVVNYNRHMDEELLNKLGAVVEKIGTLLDDGEIAEATDIKAMLFQEDVVPYMVSSALYLSNSGRSHVFSFIKDIALTFSNYIGSSEEKGHLLMSHVANSDAAMFERASGFSIESEKVVTEGNSIQGSLFSSDSTHSKASGDEMRNAAAEMISAFSRAENYVNTVLKIMNNEASKPNMSNIDGYLTDLAGEISPNADLDSLTEANLIEDVKLFKAILDSPGDERITNLMDTQFTTELFLGVTDATSKYVDSLEAVEDPTATDITVRSKDINITRPYHLVEFGSNVQFITTDLRPVYINSIVLMASPYVQSAYEKFNLLTFFISKQLIEYCEETAEYWAAFSNKFPDNEVGRIATYLQDHVKLKHNEMFNFLSFYSISDTKKQICTGLTSPFKAYGKGENNSKAINVPLSSGVHSITGRAQSGKDLIVAAIQENLLDKVFIRKDGTDFKITNNDMLIIDMMERSAQATSDIKPHRVRSDNFSTLVDLLSNRDEKIIFINSITNLIDTLGIGDTTSTGIRQTAYDSVVSALNTFGESAGKVIFILTRGNTKQIPYMQQILSGASWTVFTMGPNGEDGEQDEFTIISRENIASSEEMVINKSSLFKSLDKYKSNDDKELDNRLNFILD